MSDTDRQGWELVGEVTAALGQVREPDRAVTVGLELLAARLGAQAGVAWALDPTGHWRLLSSCGEPRAVEQLLVRHPEPDPNAGVELEGPAGAGVQVWVGSSQDQPIAALRLEDLAGGWDDEEELAPLAAAVGEVMAGAWEHLTQRQRYEQTQRVAGVGSWQWQADTDEVWLSEQMYRNLGTNPESFEHTLAGYLARVHPDDRDLVADQVERARSAGGLWHTRHRLVTERGEVRWLEGQGRVEYDEHGATVRIAGAGQDITARHELEEELRSRAQRDELTGLANRHAFHQRLTQTLERDIHQGDHTVVALVDVDGFRRVNEHWGWATGDRLLQKIAERLRGVEGAELAARLSADEFALLFHRPLQPAEVEQLGANIVAHLHHPTAPGVEGRTVDLAVGLASTLHDGSLSDELLRAAGVALQVAKNRSNVRWQVFDPVEHEQALQRQAMEADLRQAVEQGDIEVAYQPVLSLVTGDVTAVEALARWDRAGHGPVSPETFIPIAERARLMPRLGAHVLETACRQLRAWDQLGPDARQLQIAVNLSPVQLDDPALLDVVDDTLARAGLEPDRLVLEITETTLGQDLPGALARLFELRRRGIRIAIDDFGTGYSSLSRLREIPFDVLKIDRSFVKDIASRHEATPILHALFSISRSLDLDVVAEGIETPVQLAVMLAHNCQSAQGFLFSRPVGPADIATLLTDGSSWDLHSIAGKLPTAKTSPRLQALLDEVASGDGRLSPPVLAEALVILAELTGLESVYLTSIDVRRDVQHILASYNQGSLRIDEGAQVPWTDTLCRRALAAGTPVIADVQREYPDAHVAEELGIGTYVGVEVRGPTGGLRGTLCGATSAVTDIPPETTETLKWIARLLADTIQKPTQPSQHRRGPS